MKESWAYWLFKWYTVRSRTQLKIYGWTYPFAFRSSSGFALGNSFRKRGIFDRISLLSKYRCNIVQCKVATALQYNSVHCNYVLWRWFWGQFYFPHKSRDSVPPVCGDFFLEIGFMKQHICYWKKYGDLFNLFYLHMKYCVKTKLIALDWQWVTLRSWCQMKRNGHSSPVKH